MIQIAKHKDKYSKRSTTDKQSVVPSQSDKDEIDAFITANIGSLPNGEFIIAHINKSDEGAVIDSLIRYKDSNNKLQIIKA